MGTLHLSPRNEVRQFTTQRVHQSTVLIRASITGTVDHGISHGIYFLDPDGHQLEVFQQRTGSDEVPKAVFRQVGAMGAPIELETIRQD